MFRNKTLYLESLFAALYMEWRTDSNLLAKKILQRIEKSKVEVSYSDLEKIATDKNIDLNIFDAAITKLHRFKKVTQRVKKEEIYYKAVPKPKKIVKPARQCLVTITDQSSTYFSALVYPLSEFKREDDTLYQLGAVVTPGYGENRIWFCPTDIGLKKNDLPIPAERIEAPMPFPEIDMSWIILRPAEMLEYKAAAKGIPMYMMKKIHKK